MNYEEYEDQLVLWDEPDSNAVKIFSILLLTIPCILFLLGTILAFIIISLALIFFVVGFGFAWIAWLTYKNMNLCQLVIRAKEKAMTHECIHPLSKKKQSRTISVSEIRIIQIDIDDELYGGFSEREMYELINIKFLLKGDAEFARFSLKADHNFRAKFSSVNQLVDKLQSFTGLPLNVFRFSPHNFLGSKA